MSAKDKLSTQDKSANGGCVMRLVRQDGWASTGAIVAARIGLTPKCQIPQTFWPYLPKPTEWHHAHRNGKVIKEGWYTKEDIETARRANRAAKRRAKWRSKL